jgi:hypothetical protein
MADADVGRHRRHQLLGARARGSDDADRPRAHDIGEAEAEPSD